MHQFYLSYKEIGPQVGTSLVPGLSLEGREGPREPPREPPAAGHDGVFMAPHMHLLFWCGSAGHSETTRKWSVGWGRGMCQEDACAWALTGATPACRRNPVPLTRGIQRAAVPRPTSPRAQSHSHGCKTSQRFCLIAATGPLVLFTSSALDLILAVKDNVAFHFNENYFVYLSWSYSFHLTFSFLSFLD